MSEFGSFAANDPSTYDFSSDPQGAVGGSGSMGHVQQMVMQEQQRALIQQAIARITEIAWDKCISRPDSSLSSREVSCISNVAGTYVDTSVFVVNRMTKQTK